MKAIFTTIVLVLSLTSLTAFACPKGTHPVGGTGPHHKGGKCEATDGKGSDAKAADVKSNDKAEVKKEKTAKKHKEKKAEEATK